MINALDKWVLAAGNRTSSLGDSDVAGFGRRSRLRPQGLGFSHLPNALIITHQSVLSFHPTPTVSSVCKAQLGKGGARGVRSNHNAELFGD